MYYQVVNNLAYNSKSIIKDVNDKPVPQYWNKTTQQYEVISSTDGRLRVIMLDNEGNEVQTQSLVDQISAKIDELIGVVIQFGL